MTRLALIAALLLLAFGCKNPDTTSAPGDDPVLSGVADGEKEAAAAMKEMETMDDAAMTTYECRCGVTKTVAGDSAAPS